MTELVRSIGYDQGEIIRNILRLHVPEGRIDCDPTFSTGAFSTGRALTLPLCALTSGPRQRASWKRTRGTFRWRTAPFPA